MSKKATHWEQPGDESMDPGYAVVAKAFARDRQVTTGKVMASVGLKVKGKILAMLVRGRFVAKLPKARVDELVRSGAGEYFDPRGDGWLMKEWVVLAGTKTPWIELAREARRFVRGAEAK